MRDFCVICNKEYELDYPYQRRQRREDLCSNCDIFNEGYIVAERGDAFDIEEALAGTGYTLNEHGRNLWRNGYNSWAVMNPKAAKERERAKRKDRVKSFTKRWNRSGNAEITVRS